MKLTHIMERAELVESVEYGWIHWAGDEFEVNEYSSQEILGSIALDEYDTFINLRLDIEVDATEYDASFGYDYGSISGVHHATEVDGEGVTITHIRPDFDSMDDKELIRLAKFLRVPGRKRKDHDTLWKYFIHGVGGEKKIIKDLHKAIDYITDELMADKVQSDKDNYEDFDVDDDGRAHYRGRW